MHALGLLNWGSYPGGGGGKGYCFGADYFFCLKKGIAFAHFGPESGMVYKGTR